MQDIVHAPAHVLAAAIRSRRISSTEVLEAHLARIHSCNPVLNAIVTLDEEGARRSARLTDESLARGEPGGPLAGVPFTLKDCHATAGVRTTAGFLPLADHVPEQDGMVAARLKAAGAILVGKTNVPPLAMSLRTENPIFGRTSNPWDMRCSPGGSSGGAAAAVAACLTPFDIGSDLCGSIRIPAHYCGVFGLKPTVGRLPVTGHIPPMPGTPRIDRRIAVVGPIARCVEDIALLCSVLAGPDGSDMEVPPVPWRKVPRRETRSLRIAFLPSFPGVPTSHAVVATVERMAKRLEAEGTKLERREPGASFEEILSVWRDYFPLLAAAMNELSGMKAAKDFRPPTLAEWVCALDRREALMQSVEALFEEFDAFLCPAVIAPAFPHDTPAGYLPVDGEMVASRYVDHYLLPFTLTGHPALVVPAGLTDEGMPVGVQLVGRRFADEELLATATTVIEVIGGFTPPRLHAAAGMTS